MGYCPLPSQEVTAVSPCPICNSELWTPIIEKSGYRYVRCVSCQSAYLSPMPLLKEVEAVYHNLAYFEGSEAVGYRSYVAMHKALAPHFRQRLRQLAHALPERGCLVDVGLSLIHI